VPVAIDRAIREIIQPVVERSVTIACVTTRELMLKDFAMEPDEVRMKKAAQLMAQTLAGSLALVTCKEPLRVACSNNMRGLLQQAGVETQLMEQVVQVCSSENLDLCCTLIEKAAKEKAVRDVEESLAPAFAIRRKHREQTGLPYYDMSIFTSGRYPASLPEALRPKAGGLLPAQRRVYEDFSRIPRVTAALAQQSGAGVAPFQMPNGASALGGYPLPGPGGGTDSLVFSRGGVEGTLPLGGQMNQIPSSIGQMTNFASTPLLGGQPSSAGSGTPGLGSDSLSTAQALEKLSLITANIDAQLAQLAPSGVTSMASLQQDFPERFSDLHNLIRQVGSLAACAYTRDESALALVQRIFKRMYEQASAASRLPTQINVHIILAIQNVSKKVSRFVTDLLFYSDDEHKLHGEVVNALLHAGLVSMAELSGHLAKHIEGGHNLAATNFAVRLVRSAVVEEQIATTVECTELLQELSKLLHSSSPPDGLVRLLEDVSRLLSVPISAIGASNPTAESLVDLLRVALSAAEIAGEPDSDAATARAREQVAPLWSDWVAIYDQPNQRDKAYATFLSALESAGWLRADTQGDYFLKTILEAALSAAALSAPADGGGKLPVIFAPLDAFSTLIVLIVKHIAPDPAPGLYSSDSTKPHAQVAFLAKALSFLITHLMHSYDTRPQDFNQRAYLRIFGSLLFELGVPDPSLDLIRPHVLTTFAAAFLALEPTRLPGFAFAWLELISHRMFMPKTLLTKGQRGWPHMQRLLVCLFAFLKPQLSSPELSAPTRTLYRGALRVLLVLLHDFPEFLCEYHFVLCEVIPPSCIQMRNLVLSAFPRNMRLPDPFTPNLKVDMLPEIAQPPRMVAPSAQHVPASLLADLDSFLTTRQPFTFVLELRTRLTQPDGAPRVAIINALVLHVGLAAIAALRPSQGPFQMTAELPALANSTHMEVYQRLVADLGAESRYVLLNGIANQLRYPNSHTHYFSCVMLHLFAEANDERVQEQITRVLVERLIVHRPHPWGLLITFIELIKNPRYNFWSRNFTRCAPEIERLFESVARSCMPPGNGGLASQGRALDADS